MPDIMIPYVKVAVLLAILTVVLHFTGMSLDPVNMAMLYLLPVLLSSVRFGLGPSLFAATMGVGLFDFFFVPPYDSFAVSDLRFLISFAVFLTIAILTATLSARLRSQLNQAKRQERFTAELYEVSQGMVGANDLASLLTILAERMSAILGAEVAFYSVDSSEQLVYQDKLASSESGALAEDRQSMLTIARWVYQNQVAVGRGTETLSESNKTFLPLTSHGKAYGVMVLESGHEASMKGVQEKRSLVNAMCALAAVAVGKMKLQQEAKMVHLTAESERIRTAVLDSISHELRTPLATITAAVSGLLEEDGAYDERDRQDLLLAIREGAGRMNRLVANLLNMVRLESGMLTLNRQWCVLEDILGVALTRTREAVHGHQVEVRVDSGFPPVYVDEVLMEQLCVNLLSNALKYSPSGTKVSVDAEWMGQTARMSISDEGPGVVESDLQHIFTKFYRALPTRHIPGTGLGLAICKGIIEAHGGDVYAVNRQPRGLTICVEWPIPESVALEGEQICSL
ncbi:MAG: DUF4118 domain-containing protein [Alicyclobacillaceae bacterium]|nr:DUF4118 domain-containing protein [Alicyclobacillaceae bacterium]